MKLELRGLTYGYYGTSPLFRDVNLTLAQGRVGALIGPSGCGKTTLLRVIAGLVRPWAGRVMLGDRDVTALPAERRGVGMVFQDYALFPHLTVRRNLLFGCGGRMNDFAARVVELLRLSDLLNRYPHQLSGGQQQRAALARSLIPRPAVLLLDEPFSNLDGAIRGAVRGELKEIMARFSMTGLLVTHDEADARALADLFFDFQALAGREA